MGSLELYLLLVHVLSVELAVKSYKLKGIAAQPLSFGDTSMTINRRDLLKGLVVSAAAVPALKVTGLPAAEMEPVKASPKPIEPVIGDTELVIDLNQCIDYHFEESKSYMMPRAGSGTMDLNPIHFIDTGKFLSVSIVCPTAYSRLHDHLIEHNKIRVIGSVNGEPAFEGYLYPDNVSISVPGPEAEVIMEIQGKVR